MGVFRKREKNAANKVDVAAAEGDVVKQISQSQAIKSAQGSSAGGPFTRAIVVEVIGEPEVFLENALKEGGPYEKNLKHVDSVKAAPRNSLIIQILDEKTATQYDVAYPMMSSHIMMPIKVGELVWIYDDGAPYKFWFSRIGGSGVAEDVNFTHKDREKETPLEEEKDAKSKADKAQGKKNSMVQIPSDQIKSKEILDWKGLHLFHFRGSSCSQKLRIYLNLKGISWTPHSINLASGKNYSEWFLGINPKGLVPVLVDDGHVEIESNDILDYLEKKIS